MDYLATIKNGRFTFLWLAQILSQIAANLLNFSLIINVYNATGPGSKYANILVSLLVLAYGLPSIFFATAAGALVDRWNPRYVLLGSNVIRAGLVLLYLPFHNNLWLLLGLTFVISTVSQVFVPAESSTIPSLVPKQYLLAANSLFVFSLYASFIVGYAVAAPVIAWFGPMGPYLVTGAMFLLAAVSILGLPRNLRDNSAKRDTGVVGRDSFWKELTVGIKIIRSHRWLGFAIRQLTITQAIVSIVLTLAPALSLALLHLPLQNSSQYLIIPAGLGMVTGVIVVGQLAKRWSRIRVLEVSLVAAGANLTLLGLSGLLYRTHDGHQIVPFAQIGIIVAVLVFTLGMLNAIISSTAQTLLQENASEESRGKVFGSLNMFINMAATLPILVTGVMADLLSPTEVITFMGLGVVAYAIWQLGQLMKYRREGGFTG